MVTTTFLPNTRLGAISQQLIAAGGAGAPYTWNANYISGLNPNLAIASGNITGSFLNPGTYNFNLCASENITGKSNCKEFQVNAYGNPQIASSTVPAGNTGFPYSVTFSGTGGLSPYTWSYTGALPSWLTPSVVSGNYVLNGTPPSKNFGGYPFTVKLTDDLGGVVITRNVTLNVYDRLTINTDSLPSATVGKHYSQTVNVTGGNEVYQWSNTGALPDGLSVNKDTGLVSGTPTKCPDDRTFTVNVTDSEMADGKLSPVTASKSFFIATACEPLVLTGASLSGTAGTYFSFPLPVTGGMRPYNWSITSGSLPSGLTLDAATSTISGFPADVGDFTVTVQVADSQGTPAKASQSYDFRITNGVMQQSAEKSTVVGCEASAEAIFCSTTNVITGTVHHDQSLFSTNGGGALGTAIDLFYQSQPPYNGPLGPGWTHSYDIFLTETTDGSVVLQDGIGSKSFYTKSGSSYVSPPGDFSILEKSGGSYSITYRDGLKKNFRSDGKISSIVDRFNNAISFSYTGSDLTGITDPAGRPTTIAYDQSVTPHRISFITDPNGKVYDFTYQGTNCSNQLCRVTNPVADESVSAERGYWEYQYDAAGYLKSKRDPAVNTSQYSYYADHRMEKGIDPEGRSRTIVYPAATGMLRTSTLTEKDGGLWQYIYDANTGVIKEKVDPNGKSIKYTYYANGNLKSKTEPKDGAVRLTTFYTYDSYGNVLTQTEPVDLSIYAAPNNDPETIADPATLASLSPSIKPAIRYTYDNANYDRLISVSDERVTPFSTATIAYATESGGEVVTATATPGNYTSVIKKYSNGAVKETTDANGKKTSFTYMSSAGKVGLLETVTDPAGIATTITGYDNNGNPQGVTLKDKNGVVRLTTSQQHDALNRLERLTKTTTAAPTLPNIVTQYGYDHVGNMTSLIDAEGKPTTYEYRYDRKVKKITDAKLNETIFTYSGSEGNGIDQLIGVYDANVTKNTPLASQPHTGFSYDKLGRLDTETDQLGKKIHYTYYDNGLVHEKYDATNSTPGTLLVTYTYNNRGQVTDKAFTDGTYEHYTYKPDGKLETAANQNITYTYAYYDDGRLHTVTDNSDRQISYDQYDNLGQRKQVTILKGAGADERVITYDYDTANRPWHIYNGTKTFTYAYDTLGRRDTLTYPNGTTADWDFDDLNRLTAITHKVTNGAAFAAFKYTDYDKVGNRKIVSGSKNETYGYDELYRLLTVTATKPETFADYDAAGNRQVGPGPSDTGYVHNTANQMTQGRKLGYEYDNFGNQTTRTVPGASDKSWVQTWDLNNRLTKVEKTKGSEKRTVSFKYDPLGRRIEKRFDQTVDGVTKSQTSTYIYDGANVAVEIYTENNAATKTFYTQGPAVDEHLAMERGGQFYYFHTDGLGSVATITDANKAVVQSYEYDSYGMVTPATDFRNSYTYTGREWDAEAGLYYYRARYYDPMEGRFISKDPIGFAGGDVNIYRYVKGNPLNLVDPFGLWDAPSAIGFLDNPKNGYAGFKSTGYCARAVRKALNAGGIATPNNPDEAYKYDNYMPKLGFHKVDIDEYVPEQGDIAVFPPIKGNSSGHIEIYDGSKWRSDYIQPARKDVDKNFGNGFIANRLWAQKPFAIFRKED